MTTGEYLVSISTLDSATALQHMSNINMTGGIEYRQSFSANISNNNLKANVALKSFTANISNKKFTANIKDDKLSVDIDNNFTAKRT